MRNASIVPVTQGRFNDSDLEYHKSIYETIGKQLHPHIFLHPKYKGIKLFNIDEIDFNNEYGGQKVRYQDNPKYKKIRKSIGTEGYDLANPPPCVVNMNQRVNPVGDGRTRGGILEEFNFTNLIAAEFDTFTEQEFLEFGFMANKEPYDSGFSTKADLKFTISNIIKSFGNKITSNQMLNKIIVDEVTKLAPAIRSLTKADRDEIIFQLMNDNMIGNHGKVLSFKNGTGVSKWLKEHGYVDTDKIMYIPVTTWAPKAMEKIIHAVKDNPNKKEFRVVCHGSVLESSAPVKDWYDRCTNFDKTFKSHLEDIALISFNKNYTLDPRIKIYGTIPMVNVDNIPMECIFKFQK